tara:strand:- start:26 stop:454 length:429 start_codon:yes stop_codon:yes gene_type:complete
MRMSDILELKGINFGDPEDFKKDVIPEIPPGFYVYAWGYKGYIKVGSSRVNPYYRLKSTLSIKIAKLDGFRYVELRDKESMDLAEEMAQAALGIYRAWDVHMTGYIAGKKLYSGKTEVYNNLDLDKAESIIKAAKLTAYRML